MEKQLIDISSSTIFRVVLVILALVLLWVISDVVLILLFSIVIASAVDPAASWLKRHGIPRALGVLAVYAAVFLTVGAIIYLIVPPLINEVKALGERFPSLLERLIQQFQGSFVQGRYQVIFERVEDYVGDAVERLTLLSPQAFTGNFAGGVSALVAGISSVLGGVFSAVLTVIISFYLAVREKGIENFLRSVTPFEHEAYIVGLWQRSQQKMGLWAQGQLALAAIIGILVYVGLFFLGVPFALTLALLAALLEFVPMVGPVLAAIPAVILGFFQSPLTGLLTIAFYSILQPLENHILVPQVMRRTLGLSPVIIIIALLVGAKLGGIVGMLLSLPLAAALNEFFNDLTEKKTTVSV